MTVANPGQSSSTQATMSLVLGILSLICCPLLAPIAWFLGSQELKAVREGSSPAGGEGIAKAGMILGIIGSLWMILVALWIFLWGGLAILQGLANM